MFDVNIVWRRADNNREVTMVNTGSTLRDTCRVYRNTSVLSAAAISALRRSLFSTFPMLILIWELLSALVFAQGSRPTTIQRTKTLEKRRSDAAPIDIYRWQLNTRWLTTITKLVSDCKYSRIVHAALLWRALYILYKHRILRVARLTNDTT